MQKVFLFNIFSKYSQSQMSSISSATRSRNRFFSALFSVPEDSLLSSEFFADTSLEDKSSSEKELNSRTLEFKKYFQQLQLQKSLKKPQNYLFVLYKDSLDCSIDSLINKIARKHFNIMLLDLG